jgi:hypothetical protein
MTDTNAPNHTLDRRREEKAVEHLVQDGATRFTELATAQMEVWQRQMALGNQVVSYWHDAFNIGQQSLSRMIDNVQQRKAT